ncbi:hypothetical protein CGI64_12105 [Vibrio parahaemolyticus]|nr:hypothetical protein CGI64_12105 [Vibrio parahaemolyticus]
MKCRGCVLHTLIGRYTYRGNMEQIIHNLKDPSWWFTGVFFVVLGIVLTWIVPRVSRLFPYYKVEFARRRKLQRLKFIHQNRQHQVLVNWYTARYWAIATVSIIYMVFAGLMYTISPEIISNGYNKIALTALFLPIYIINFVVMETKKKATSLVRAHIAWNQRSNKNNL